MGKGGEVGTQEERRDCEAGTAGGKLHCLQTTLMFDEENRLRLNENTDTKFHRHAPSNEQKKPLESNLKDRGSRKRNINGAIKPSVREFADSKVG